MLSRGLAAVACHQVQSHTALLHRTALPTATAARRGALFACLKQQLPALNYTAQLDAWLEAFPAEQVMLLQVCAHEPVE